MRVEKTRENLRECLCLHCPSYTTACKMKNMPENLLKMLEPINEVEHFEGMYCAFDRSHCIHEDKGCICDNCEVHKKYNLKKEDYCLKNGGM